MGIPHAESSGNVHSVEFGTIPWWKRSLDVGLLLISSPVVVPVMLFLAAYVKTVSPGGPVFFRQERVGLRGRKFLIYKFRSMKPDADTLVHQKYFAQLTASNRPMTKMDERGDPRLIAGGWFLRASGLDELPQVVNVLRGEMSLVGPRPCTTNEYRHYQAWQTERFNTLPGLTGLWQVNGKNKTTFVQMVQLDIQYARTKTFGLDLKIMARTFRVLFHQVHQVRQANGKVQSDEVIRSAIRWEKAGHDRVARGESGPGLNSAPLAPAQSREAKGSPS